MYDAQPIMSDVNEDHCRSSLVNDTTTVTAKDEAGRYVPHDTPLEGGSTYYCPKEPSEAGPA
jgi:hypothetical protein